MNHKSALGGIIFLVAFLASVAAAGIGQDRPAGPEDLQKKIAALEERVAKLEETLQKITVSIPQSFPNLKSLPTGWTRFEFNGVPYFIIPLNQQKSDTPVVIR